MSDRIKGLVVHLDKDYKDEDAENITQALLMIKGVVQVEPIRASFEDHINRSRIKSELKEKIFNILCED